MLIFPTLQGIQTPVTGSASNLLLDVVGNTPIGAYSVARKLRSAYSGSAIRVRRSSDNTEQDIGFTGANVLDSSALTTFVGSGNGFVTIVYDQSTAGRNMIQATTANQPLIVSSGTIVTAGSRPSMTFSTTGTTFLRWGAAASTTLGSILATFRPTTAFTQATSNNTLVGHGNSATYSLGFGSGPGLLTNEVIFMRGSASGNDTGVDNNGLASVTNVHHLIGSIFAGTSSLLYLDNSANLVNINNGTGADAVTASRQYQWGVSAATPTGYFNGESSELVLFSDNINANWSTIRSNVNTFYSIF